MNMHQSFVQDRHLLPPNTLAETIGIVELTAVDLAKDAAFLAVAPAHLLIANRDLLEEARQDIEAALAKLAGAN